MTDEADGGKIFEGTIHHLPKSRKQPSLREQISQDIAQNFADHFRDQNEVVRRANAELSAQVQRLMGGIDRLLGEMDGVRTGVKAEAFARVGASHEGVDLPTVSAESALFYTHTATDIAEDLQCFNASQIGLLLSSRGLKWAGNGDYQELSRNKKVSQTKWWHKEVPDRLRAILDAGKPQDHGITDRGVLTIFRLWQEKTNRRDLLENLSCDSLEH